MSHKHKKLSVEDLEAREVLEKLGILSEELIKWLEEKTQRSNRLSVKVLLVTVAEFCLANPDPQRAQTGCSEALQMFVQAGMQIKKYEKSIVLKKQAD